MAKCELCGGDVDEKNHSYPFHRQMFRMIKLAYDNWEPPPNPEWKSLFGTDPKKCFKTFRKNVIIAAGHYDAVFDFDGKIEFVPHSMSYKSADPEKFMQMYKDIHEVLGERALKRGDDEFYDKLMLEF